MKNKKPLVIFDGNCQGQHLAAILTATQIADCYAIGQDLGYVPSHLGVACSYLDEDSAHELITDAKSKGVWVIQGTQSTPMSDGREMSYSHLVDQIIRYPHLQFYAASPSETAARFGPRATPQRMLDMDLSVIETCQKRSGTKVDFLSFIKENCFKRSLFHTALHPNGEITAMMVRSFADQISGVDQVALIYAERYLRSSQGINSSTYHPVPKDLLDRLHFNWGDSYELYRQMLEQRGLGDWQGILQNKDRYIENFKNDTWCWVSLTQAEMAAGTLIGAESALLRLLELSPGSLSFWMMGMDLYLKRSKPDDILSLAHRAKVFFRGQRVFSQVMAFFHINMGQAEEALPFARDYFARTPDRGDALVPLLITLGFMSQHDEIRQILDFEVAHASPGRIGELRANFANIPNLISILEARLLAN